MAPEQFQEAGPPNGLESSMQSSQDLAKMAAVDRELMKSRVHAILNCLAAKDLPGSIRFFSDEVVFDLIGNWSIFPNARPGRGKEAWARALATIHTQLENLGSTIHDFAIDGECVALRRTTRVRNYGTGKVGDVEIANFMRFRDGLVVEFTEIVDSLAIAQLEEC